MSFEGYGDAASRNNSYDWDVVLAGTGTWKSTTVFGLGQYSYFYNHPSASSSTAWVQLFGDGTTQLSNLAPSGPSAFPGLTANKTINIPSGSTSAEIQTLINAEPRNLNGYELTLQFADATYTLSSTISFTAFHGGFINIYGNSSDTGSGSGKSVLLLLNHTDELFDFNGCSAFFVFRYIQASAQSQYSADDDIFIRVRNGTNIRILDCFLSSSNQNGTILADVSASIVFGDASIQNLGYGVTSRYNSFVTAQTDCTLASNVTDMIATLGGYCNYQGNVATDSVSYAASGGGQVGDNTGWL